MRVSIDEIKSRVYELLDENAEILAERVDYADPGTALGPLIERLLPEAAREVILAVPADDIDECAHTRLRVDSGRAPLPADFLRLICFRMPGWTDGVTIPLKYNGDAHRLRMRKYDKVRFRRTRPAVAVRQTGASRTLLVYGDGAESGLAELDYVASPEIKDSAIELPRGAVPTVCRRLAAMTAEIIGDRKWE